VDRGSRVIKARASRVDGEVVQIKRGFETTCEKRRILFADRCTSKRQVSWPQE